MRESVKNVRHIIVVQLDTEEAERIDVKCVASEQYKTEQHEIEQNKTEQGEIEQTGTSTAQAQDKETITRPRWNWQRIGSALSTAAVAVVVVGAIALMGLRAAGYQMFTILSGSMEPQYPVGAMIYVKPAENLQVGDVITFATSEKTTVTHRINEIITETTADGSVVTKYRTKGDANAATDGQLVRAENVIGTPIVTIPLAGYASMFFQSPPGMFLLIMAVVLLIGAMTVPQIFKTRGKEGATRESRV